MDLPETHRKLFLLADRTVAKMKDHIKRAGKYNTGQLYNSVGWKPIKGGLEFYVKAPYSQYVIQADAGGKPMPSKWKKQPKIEHILPWMQTPHGTRAYANIKKRWPSTTIKGAAYIICRSIKEKGIKPVDFYNPYINQLYKVDAFHELEAAFATDMEKEIQKNINK